MGKIILDISMSLDGIVAKTDNYRLHEWYFKREDNSINEVVDELIQDTGAIIMGRTNYGLGDYFDGFVNNPYQVPHFVLTHSIPDQLPKGDTTFIFVSNGIESALAQAKAAACDKHVIIAGGVNTAQQYIKAGLLDEIHIHLVPVVLGDGLHLFEHNSGVYPDLECMMVKPSPGVTHLQYRIVK
ncbi:hypothetical protein PAECIP111893_03919 [Paenibacillus plantiphilus]|uniref:Bacterial bifunctional deaminase-reductase C-terminal domain-containing protein n=1 Tax=Paenibacillus plantiphilus TaxID=2905650 RepID=A0ABM9CKK3_9BACL|nr:dihydrofolate reductase family protein [Paenibacillus plantiphilus]CAH1215310.1 hypothetical protein PAECIP111893_03919 [Paenibacillus plantiphilus]